MKHSLLLPAALICCTAFSQSNYLDNYLSGTPTYNTISSGGSISNPRDLEFKPNTNELWVVNKGGSGGTTVIISNAGLTTQTTMYRKDSNSSHFWQRNGTAMAFGENGLFASSGEDLSPVCTFMGPSLWSGDLEIYAKVFQGTPGMLGSHLYMNHQSPSAMGIAYDNARVYWVFDGTNGNICKYDFTSDHGPGNTNHSQGKIYRYESVTVTRVPDLPSHMVVDKANAWLYYFGANKTLKRFKTTTGTDAGSLTCGNETLAAYRKMTGGTMETIDTYTSQPVGVDYHNNRLIVSHTNGDITIYNTSGASPVKLGVVATGQTGIKGVKIGTDGKIWFVNSTANSVVRMTPASPSAIDAGIVSITSPTITENLTTAQNQTNYFGLGYDACGSSITPAVTLINSGSSTLTSVTINYKIDNGAPGSFNWTGSLASNATTSVTLPSIAVTAGPHKLTVYTSSPNGGADANLANDTREGSFRAVSPVTTLSEGFSSATFPPAGWDYIGIKNPFSLMSRNASVGGNSPGCAKMDEFSSPYSHVGQVDHLMSPQVDLTSSPTTAVLEFNVAHAVKSGSGNEALKVQVSTNCGSTWTTTSYNKSGSTLSTAPATSSAFTPSGASQWRKESISLAPYIGQKVIFAFTITGASGNNIYLDDINVVGAVGIIENDLAAFISVFPNPASDYVTIVGANNILVDATISLHNVLGEEIIKTNSTSNYMDIDLSSYSNGVYFLNIHTDKGAAVKKIVVNK